MKHFSRAVVVPVLSLTMLVVLVSCKLFSAQSTPTQQGALSASTPQGAQATNQSVSNSPIPATKPPTEANTPQPTMDLSNLPALAELQDGWSQIDPGGNTTCARGGKYSFFVRKAESDKLLIYFEGGGSCYDANTCQPGSQIFDDSIDPAFPADNPALKVDGVFATGDSRNPFQNYNIVFVSYCTGDGFLGNKVVDYQVDNNHFQINHVGFENTQTVLNWTYNNFRSPSSVFVIGCSAGTVGSFFHAPFILEHYKDTPMGFVGDSGGGFLEAPASFVTDLGIPDLVPNWIPAYQSLIEGNFHTSMVFTIPATNYPQAQFSLLDTLEDSVQTEIIAQLGGSVSLQDVIFANLNGIRAVAPNFRSYSGPGDHHCITMDPIFPEYSVNGILLRNWITDLSEGKSVENVAP
jgi:hypothetical protein